MVLLEEIEGFKKKLKCPICNSAEKDAILTKCFHVFCYHCLKTRYETRTGSLLAKNLFLLKLTIYCSKMTLFDEFSRQMISLFMLWMRQFFQNSLKW